MVKADLHNHLRTSSNLKEKDFNNAIDLASERLGKNGIFTVVNFKDARYEDFINLNGYERRGIDFTFPAIYIPNKKIFVVKGQEVPTRQGHLLVLGLEYNSHLKNNKNIEYTLNEATDNNGIIILDHPFYIAGTVEYFRKNSKLLEKIDAIEIHNAEAAFGFPVGPFPMNANKKAEKFYSEIKNDYLHIGAITSSDGHLINELGKNWTEIEEIGGYTFVESLKKSIRNTDENTTCQKSNSYLSAIEHITKLIYIETLKKIGKGEKYQATDSSKNIDPKKFI